MRSGILSDASIIANNPAYFKRLRTRRRVGRKGVVFEELIVGDPPIYDMINIAERSTPISAAVLISNAINATPSGNAPYQIPSGNTQERGSSSDDDGSSSPEPNSSAASVMELSSDGDDDDVSSPDFLGDTDPPAPPRPHRSALPADYEVVTPDRAQFRREMQDMGYVPFQPVVVSPNDTRQRV